MTDPKSTPDDDDALAAEYVVGLLGSDDRRAVERRMRNDAAFAERVAAWESRLDGLNDAYGAIIPPARVKARIDKHLFATPRLRRPWLGWIGALASAAALVLAVFVWQFDSLSDPDLRAQLGNAEQPAQVLVEVDRDSLRVDLATATPPQGSIYELWLVPDGEAPVSLGTFAADARLSVDPAQLIAGATLAVSIEPVGGSPTGAPTGPVIASGVLEDA